MSALDNSSSVVNTKIEEKIQTEDVARIIFIKFFLRLYFLSHINRFTNAMLKIKQGNDKISPSRAKPNPVTKDIKRETQIFILPPKGEVSIPEYVRVDTAKIDGSKTTNGNKINII